MPRKPTRGKQIIVEPPHNEAQAVREGILTSKLPSNIAQRLVGRLGEAKLKSLQVPEKKKGGRKGDKRKQKRS